jgi:hypothetical protein
MYTYTHTHTHTPTHTGAAHSGVGGHAWALLQRLRQAHRQGPPGAPGGVSGYHGHAHQPGVAYLPAGDDPDRQALKSTHILGLFCPKVGLFSPKVGLF